MAARNSHKGRKLIKTGDVWRGRPMQDAVASLLSQLIEQGGGWPQVRANAIANWEGLRADITAWEQLKTFAATPDVRAAPRLSVLLDAFVERLGELEWNEAPTLAALTKLERRAAAAAGVTGYKNAKAARAREGQQLAVEAFKTRTRAEWATGKHRKKEACAESMEKTFKDEFGAWAAKQAGGRAADSVPKNVRKAIQKRRNRIPELATIVGYLENQ